ncbi:ABC transporter permease [Aliidiomarina sp.]|uniref:ABC transporter permease n=1 Tax=Aliidiomarina sp. TaxID=1872439 RepID=UPI003A4E4886
MMFWKRFIGVFTARNLEFLRDKESLSWNLVFPLVLVAAFAFLFDSDDRTIVSVGVVHELAQEVAQEQVDNDHTIRVPEFASLSFVEQVPYTNREQALRRLQQHQLDLVIAPAEQRYWLNESSPGSALAAELLTARSDAYTQEILTGQALRYVDWVLPGILAMNLMFSCLYGVGYVIVRYRKNSVLKRLQATPLSAFEFLLAQVASRVWLVIVTLIVVYLICNAIFSFVMEGSYLLLILLAFLGSLCISALGLLIAARTRSEELSRGLLDFVAWPMLLLSGVWFSLDSSPVWVQQFAQIFPLTHLLAAARAVMFDGAGLVEILPQIMILLAMTLAFLLLGARLFRWIGDGR